MLQTIDSMLEDAKRGLVYADMLDKLNDGSWGIGRKGSIYLTDLAWEVATSQAHHEGVYTLFNEQVQRTVKALEQLRELVL